MNTPNTIQLIGHYGSDEVHALAAWTSTGGAFLDEVEEKTGKPRRERIPALLKGLADAGHHTPFERSMLHFQVDCEVASHIHIIKHRIGVSVNGESARYKELQEDRWHIPGDWPLDWQGHLNDHCHRCFSAYHAALKDLEQRGYSRKRAKESARFFLPYATVTTMDLSFNWRSFHHFLSLRKKATAQDEIHEIAYEMLKVVASITGRPFAATIKAFGYSCSTCCGTGLIETGPEYMSIGQCDSCLGYGIAQEFAAS